MRSPAMDRMDTERVLRFPDLTHDRGQGGSSDRPDLFNELFMSTIFRKALSFLEKYLKGFSDNSRMVIKQCRYDARIHEIGVRSVPGSMFF